MSAAPTRVKTTPKVGSHSTLLEPVAGSVADGTRDAAVAEGRATAIVVVGVGAGAAHPTG
jgi:hypothetical protein